MLIDNVETTRMLGEVPVAFKLEILRLKRRTDTGALIKMFCKGVIGSYPNNKALFYLLQTPAWVEKYADKPNFFAVQEANGIDASIDTNMPWAIVEIYMPPQDFNLKIEHLAHIAIHVQGRTIKGRATSATNWAAGDDQPPNWYIEYVIDEESQLPRHGVYGYWKQNVDGGWVEVID